MSEQKPTENETKLTPTDLNLIQSMAAVNPNSALAMCQVPQRVEKALVSGGKIAQSDAQIIVNVGDRNPNSALSQTGVPERALQSAKKEDTD